MLTGVTGTPRPEAPGTIHSAARYLWVQTLAKGGLGVVNLVLRREGRFERPYALKRLLPQLSDDEEVREMFLEEARLAGLLSHPNVVGVLDVGEDAEGPFLLMEYVEGLSVSELLRHVVAADDLLPIGVALRIVDQAARGLRAAHELVTQDGRELTLIHRDVSPQNILVGFDGVVRVVDFGIAKAIGGDGQSSTHALKGKHGYMSPEQLRFERLDARTDVYALGVVLFELLTGRRLYPGRKLDEVARRVLHEPPPDLAMFRGDAPPALEALLFAMLAKDRERRVASAAAVSALIAPILADVEASEGTLDVRSYMTEQLAEVCAQLRAERQAAIDRAIRRPEEETDLEIAVEVEPRGTRWRLPAAVVAGALLGAGALGLARLAMDDEVPSTPAAEAEVGGIVEDDDGTRDARGGAEPQPVSARNGSAGEADRANDAEDVASTDATDRGSDEGDEDPSEGERDPSTEPAAASPDRPTRPRRRRPRGRTRAAPSVLDDWWDG